MNWNKKAAGLSERPRIFPSLCDWLDDEVPIDWLADFLKLIHDTPNLDWLLLTKRPENWRNQMERVQARAIDKVDGHPPYGDAHDFAMEWCRGEAPQNVWIITSVEDQKRADERIPELLKIPAVIRGLSVEPMLEAIDFKNHLLPTVEDVQAVYRGESPKHPAIDWAIFGGESGPSVRPCNIEWIRSGMKQCQAAGVKVFVKQLGARPCESEKQFGTVKAARAIVLHDTKGGDMTEWPDDLKVRQFPTT